MENIYSSFLLPVIDGKIHLGQRGTPPYKGHWGPIGGKSQQAEGTAFWQRPHELTTICGGKKTSIADRIAITLGHEYRGETAVREFCEEAFSLRKYPDDFQEQDITHVHKLGYWKDFHPNHPQKNFVCYVYIATINLHDFSLATRELTELRPLEEIVEPDTALFPMAKVALAHLQYTLSLSGVVEGLEPYVPLQLPAQIPSFRPIPFQPTSMIGAIPTLFNKDSSGWIDTTAWDTWETSRALNK